MASQGDNGSRNGTEYSADESVDSATYATMDELTRRRLLALGAASSLSTMVAGCGGGDDPQATTDVEVDTTTEPDEDDMTETATETEAGETTVVEEGTQTTVKTAVRWDWDMTETTLNRFSPSNYPGGRSNGFFFAPMVLYSKGDQRYYPVLQRELPTYDRCFQLYILKKNFTFWDGKEHNAYDRVYGHQANAYVNAGGPSNVSWNAEIYEGVEEPRFAFKENKGAAYAPANAAGNATSAVHWRRDIFKPIFERFQDAESEDETQTIIEDLKDIEMGITEADEHAGGVSMWKPLPDEVAADELPMERYEDHPFADNTNLDRWVIQNTPRLQSELQLINNDGVDFGSTSFEDLTDPPSHLQTQGEFIGNNGVGMAFNWRRKVPGDRAFRRAVTYLLPMENVANAAAQTGTPTDVVTQQTTSAPEDIVGRGTNEGFLDNIIDYGLESRPEEATRVLEEAGYSKQGESWVDPDGESIEVRLVGQTLAVNSNIGAAISGTMNNFGISTNFSVLESGTYRQTVQPEAGNFDYDMHIKNDMNIAKGNSDLIQETGTAVDADADSGWDPSTIEECTSAAKNPKNPRPDVLENQEDGDGFLTWRYGVPITEDGLFPPLPEEVGQTDLSGDTYRPDLGRHNWWSSFRFEPDQIREWNTEHLWWANFYMPKVYFYTNRVPIWMDQQDFELTDSPGSDTMGESGKFWQGREDFHPFVMGEAQGQ